MESQYEVHLAQVMSLPLMKSEVRARPVVPSAIQAVEACDQPAGTEVSAALALAAAAAADELALYAAAETDCE